MNLFKLNLKVLKLTIFIIMMLFVSCMRIFHQDFKKTITLQNRSGEPVLVKLIGPSSKKIDILDQSSRSVEVKPGEYYLLVRYGYKADKYYYANCDTLVVSDTSKRPASISITLEKPFQGSYITHPITSEDFKKAYIPTAQPLLEKKSFRTALGCYNYYTWRNSILTWILDDSLEHTADELTKARPGMKFLTLHFSIPEDQFSMADLSIKLADYKIRDKHNNWYHPMGGSLDAGQTYFKGKLMPGTQLTIELFGLRSKPGKDYFLSCLYFEIPESVEDLIFFYQKQSLHISQILLKVSPEIMNIVNSWDEGFVCFVKKNEKIKKINQLRNKDIHIWWNGKKNAEKVTQFMKAIGKKGKINLYGHNIWEDWSEVLQKDNILIVMDTETSGRLMDDYDLKQVRFQCH